MYFLYLYICNYVNRVKCWLIVNYVNSYVIIHFENKYES